MKQSNTIYGLVIATIEGMDIGDSKAIVMPEKITAFRKYLSEISKARGQKYTTKSINGQLEIMRIKYSNIFSKELE